MSSEAYETLLLRGLDAGGSDQIFAVYGVYTAERSVRNFGT